MNHWVVLVMTINQMTPQQALRFTTSRAMRRRILTKLWYRHQWSHWLQAAHVNESIMLPEPAVTTVEDVNARVQRGCKCSGKNCFKDVSRDILFTLRNSMCTLTKDQLQCFVSGTLDVLRRRGSVSNHSRAAERQQRSARSRTTYSYEVDDTDVCKVVFTYARNILEWPCRLI